MLDKDFIEELKRLSVEFVDDTVQYVTDTTLHLALAIFGYVLFCVIVYFATVYLMKEYGHLKTVKKVLFVTAHPDDECMFFGPIILKLAQRSDCQMFLLCLSEGNYENKGKIRKQELWDSCNILGIPSSHIIICRHDHLPDDPTVRWREEIVANLILNHVESLSIDTVITFDKAGVSRHQNHVSIFYAAAYLCLEKKFPHYCRAYVLESINILRKYSGLMDVPISFLLSSYWYILSLRERDTILGLAAER
ncbi:N-acetylglucosaminyl-phosphatidylinositol de-N-acetylase isoform X2 [Anabrus simplex]|uniref:N-acetylglucosaminyl-phosphatidylinositol de-N-acetylase isoform X2 n=1 Tax=Anabrus simplex TaxID=316456 RepID=UPI0034DDA3C4